MTTFYEFEEVPPPKSAPADQIAEALGLLPGLRVEDVRSSGPWRCGECDELKPAEERQVWVPDQVRIGDDPKLVVEVCRQSAYNGSFSGWCVQCALRLGSSKPQYVVVGDVVEEPNDLTIRLYRRSWVERLLLVPSAYRQHRSLRLPRLAALRLALLLLR